MQIWIRTENTNYYARCIRNALNYQKSQQVTYYYSYYYQLSVLLHVFINSINCSTNKVSMLQSMLHQVMLGLVSMYLHMDDIEKEYFTKVSWSMYIGSQCMIVPRQTDSKTITKLANSAPVTNILLLGYRKYSGKYCKLIKIKNHVWQFSNNENLE